MGEVKKEIQIAAEQIKHISTVNTKECITDSKELLDNLKKIQKIIMKSDGEEIPMMIKIAQKNLTKTSINQCKNMIIELQKNFNDDGISLFIEKTISLITATETANLIYGDMIRIKELREYLSKKTTQVVLLRVNKLLTQLKETKYEDKIKLNFIIDNLNQCNKVLEYCWDIYPENISSLKYTINILETLIRQRIKLGLDNYNIELLKLMIDTNKKRINDLKNSSFKLDCNGQIVNNKVGKQTPEIKSNLDESLIIHNENLSTDLTVLNLNNGPNKMEQIKEQATQKFIDITNDVICEVKEDSTNNFMNLAFQKYYSIIAAIETLNYMKGTVISKEAVVKNISKLLTDMVYTNFISITSSWDSITEKTEEDYLAYAKEITNYKKLLFEAYTIYNDNIDALRKSIEIDVILYNSRSKFKISNADSTQLKNNIEKYQSIIKKEFPEFKGIEKASTKNTSKKKGFWSKLFK